METSSFSVQEAGSSDHYQIFHPSSVKCALYCLQWIQCTLCKSSLLPLLPLFTVSVGNSQLQQTTALCNCSNYLVFHPSLVKYIALDTSSLQMHCCHYLVFHPSVGFPSFCPTKAPQGSTMHTKSVCAQMMPDTCISFYFFLPPKPR